MNNYDDQLIESLGQMGINENTLSKESLQCVLASIEKFKECTLAVQDLKTIQHFFTKYPLVSFKMEVIEERDWRYGDRLYYKCDSIVYKCGFDEKHLDPYIVDEELLERVSASTLKNLAHKKIDISASLNLQHLLSSQAFQFLTKLNSFEKNKIEECIDLACPSVAKSKI